MQQTENKKSEGRFSSELFGWGESLMAVLVFFVVVFTFFVRLIGVDGMSMYPTLEDHSIMLVSNLNYTPERGDVVVLRKEGFYNNQPIVKRIIATGGDTVDIDPVTGDVSVNGEVLDEPYINETIDVLEHMGDLTYPQTAPENACVPLPLRLSVWMTAMPCSRKCFAQTAVMFGSARSMRLRIIMRGLPAAISSISGLRDTCGMRASTTSQTASTCLIYSAICRRVFVICPGYH